MEKVIKRYGASWDATKLGHLPEFHIEAACFKKGRTQEQGGLGKYGHFRKLAAITCPHVKWHPWNEWSAQKLCENSVVAMTGCAAASKTHIAGVFGFNFFLAAPSMTSVVLTSTTSKMVRKRIWPVIQELHSQCPFDIGNLVDSKTTLQATRGDDKNGIFAIAVGDGPLERALGNIKGVHNRRMMLIVDEATDTKEAIFEAINNLQKGCEEFVLVAIGNATSKLDPHGRLCEPKEGWNSINVNVDEWPIKGVSKWGIEGGVCLHFDGVKSPNVVCGEDRWPFIFTNRDLNKALSFPDAKETVGFWKETRGFWPPDGICRTVFSETLIEKFNGRGKMTFVSMKTPIAFCDFAFGGDNCVFQPAELGNLSGGKMGIHLLEPIIIPIKATDPEPVNYQIARRCLAECKARGIQPQHFGGDATGEGSGPLSIMAEEWSQVIPGQSGSKINWVEFGGSPSDMPATLEDPRTSKECYDRRVTELHWSAREYLASGQLGGMNTQACVDLCCREFEEVKRKKKMDTKAEAKVKLGHSPDHGDALVGVCEIARRMGAHPTSVSVQNRKTDWKAFVRKTQRVFEHVDYAA